MQSSSGSILQGESDVTDSNPRLAEDSMTSNLSSTETFLMLTDGTTECEGSLTGGESDLEHKKIQASFLLLNKKRFTKIKSPHT